MDLLEAAASGGARHPWEFSRRDSLVRVLEQLRPWEDAADIGAGDRFFTAALRQLTRGTVHAVDVHYEHTGLVDGIHLARDFDGMPDGSVDCVVMMDVLEHVEDEQVLLREVHRVLRQKGVVLVTVPAFSWLYSAHDAFLRHFRRYSRRQLRTVVDGHGFVVEEAFYFYTGPFAARAVQVAFERFRRPGEQRGVGNWPFELRHPFTSVVKAVLDADFRVGRAAARMGLAVPGLSLCAVCRRTSV